MHRIVIVRHAKSDWGDPSLADHDRPLATRGIRALPRLESHLAAGSPVDLVLCSSARRTLDTLAGIHPALPDDVEVEVEDELYGASALSLTDRLRRIDEEVGAVMIVGHNPGLHDMVVGLVGDGDDDLRARLATKFPTGAIATLSFSGSWAALQRGDAHLDDYFTPRKTA